MSTAPRLLHERQEVRLEFPDLPGPPTNVDATVSRISEHVLWLKCAVGAPGLRAGMRVQLRCWDAFGAYCAITQVVEFSPSSPTLFAVETALPLEAHDNRRFYRVSVQIPFVVAPVRTSDPHVSPADTTATTVDVSPGGLKFLTSLPLMVGDRLALRLVYQEVPMNLDGRVVRTVVGVKGDQREISVEFLNVRTGTQVRLVRLIFAHQKGALDRG